VAGIDCSDDVYVSLFAIGSDAQNVRSVKEVVVTIEFNKATGILSLFEVEKRTRGNHCFP
jgi:hypothetical protein